MSRDVAGVFADIDAFDPDKFVAHLTPDAVFAFGNAEPVTGRAAIRAAVAGFFATIDGLTHHVRNLWDVVAHLRADHRHHCLALVEGPSGVISAGFTVAGSDALAAAETELERAGTAVRRGSAQEARSRRVREFIAFDDPFGNRLELVSQQETVTRPVAFTRPAGITEFGHLCLDAPDVYEAYRFWSTRFNARVSDW